MRFYLKKQRRIFSFVPEQALIDQKDAQGCRVCYEDCAVLDAKNNFTPVAYRAKARIPNVNYFSYVGLSALEYAFLKDAMQTHPRVLVDSPKGAILVFAEQLQTLGILTAICFPKDTHSSLIHRAILTVGRTDVCVSPFVPLSRAPCKHLLCDRIKELFFYADTLFSPFPFANGLRHACFAIAAFSGCNVDCASALPPTKEMRQTAQAQLALFLLCVLMTLRQNDTRSSCEQNQNVKTYVLQNTNAVTELATSFTRDLMQQFPFLACECFANFGITFDGQRLCLHTPIFKNETSAVHSVDPICPFLTFYLEEAV